MRAAVGVPEFCLGKSYYRKIYTFSKCEGYCGIREDILVTISLESR